MKQWRPYVDLRNFPVLAMKQWRPYVDLRNFPVLAMKQWHPYVDLFVLNELEYPEAE